MNIFSDFWAKVLLLGAAISALKVWKMLGEAKAVGHERAKNRLEESKTHIEKMEKEKADAKTFHEIETLVSSLSDDERVNRLQSFRGKHDDNNA